MRCLPFLGLVLTFERLPPCEIESWDEATLDVMKHKPGLVLAFVMFPPREVVS